MASKSDNKMLITEPQVSSFEASFTNHYPLLYKIAYRCIGRCDEADDIVQEAFMQLYQTVPQFKSEGEQRAWLCRVVTNLSLNTLRSQKRRLLYEEKTIVSTDEMSCDPERQVIAKEQIALVRSILRDLPEKQQKTILLRRAGLSYAEIAEVVDVVPASVGSLIARAEREFQRRYHERARDF